MRRSLLLLLVFALIGLGWWKRDDLTSLARTHVPGAKTYLADAGGAPKAAAPARRTPPAVPVLLARAERKDLPLSIAAIGTVQPVASIQLKPRIDSQIAAIHVDEGAPVKQGDLLVTLDGRALAAQLAQADAMVAKDRAQLEQLRRDLARAQDLLAKNINTEVQRDTAATQVKIGEAQLAADLANRDTLATNLSYTEIRAPVTGRIGSVPLKVGTIVRAADAQAIATVNQIDPIFVSFAVPQTLFPSLRTALAAGPVPVQARLGTSTVTGTVAFLENSVDLATGTILAKARMANADERLWPGAFVSVQAMLGTQRNALAVPSAAVQLGQQGAYLFVVRDGHTASLVPVTVDRTVDGDSVISAGLKDGDAVVVDGQLRLVDGAPVAVQPGRAGVATGGDPAGSSVERRS